MTPEAELAQEHVVRRQLRRLVWVVGVLTACTLALSFATIEIFTSYSDPDTGRRVIPLWSWLERGWLMVAVAPMLWVYRSPQKHPVIVAAAWFAVTGLGLKLFEGDKVYSEDVAMPALSATFVIAIAAFVIVIMPALRLRRREQAELVPTARLHD